MSAIDAALDNQRAASTENPFLRRLLRRPSGIVALVYLAMLVVVAIAAPLLAPDNPSAQDLFHMLSGPSSGHLLGTDTLGRDLLSQLIYGTRSTLIDIAEAVATVLILSIPIGLTTGYFGGRFDRVTMRVLEVVMAIPVVVMVLVVLAVFPMSTLAAMIAFGVLGTPSIARVIRSVVLAVREDLHVTAARVAGLSHLRIVRRHVLPRVRGTIIVQASLFAAYALLFQTALAFLGLTASAGSSNWGAMVGQAESSLEQASWPLYPPGIAIALTILAFGLLGDALRDAAAVDESSQVRRRASKRVKAGDSMVPPDPRSMLSVRDLSVTFQHARSEVTVVDHVSFDVGHGETVGLVGESGCGKSVTALALLRLLPSAASVSGGAVWLEGKELTGLGNTAFDGLRGSTLGYVSQEPMSALDPVFTVGSQLREIVRRHDDISRADAQARAIELLRMVRLPQPDVVLKKYPYELSGGMAQRVSLAFALAGRPRLLIADEPTTALDVTVQGEILALIRELRDEVGMSVLLITHDWGVVADVCDRAVVMYAGETVEHAELFELFDEPLHPYSRALLESSPALAVAGEPLKALSGRVPSPESWPPGCRFADRCTLCTPECRESGKVELIAPVSGRLSRCLHVDAMRDETAAV